MRCVLPQVSALSYGAWVTFGTQVDVAQVRVQCSAAFKPCKSRTDVMLVPAGKEAYDPVP